MRLEDTLRRAHAPRFLIAGSLVLDRDDQRVWLEDERVNLGSKAMALLEELMRNPQRLVTKDRLFDVGWPDQAVSDAVLTTAIRELRRALKDPARTPAWIETQHGKGYRFLVPVVERDVHPGRADIGKIDRYLHDRRGLVALAALISLALFGLLAWQQSTDHSRTISSEVESERSGGSTLLAILPLEAKGVEPWVSEAFVSQIEQVLGQTDNVLVTDAGRSGRFPAGSQGIKEAGAEGIPQVLTGTVGRRGSRTTAVLRLVSTKDGKTIWEERFAQHSDDLLTLLETASIAVAQSIGTITDEDELVRMAELGTGSVLALAEFQKGEELLQEAVSNASSQDVRAAYRHFEKALDHDPTFARAAYALAYNRWGAFGTVFDADDRSIEDEYRDHLTLLDVAIVNAANPVDQMLYKSQKASAKLDLIEAQRLLEEYAKRRPNDESALENLMIVYAQMGDNGGVGRALDRLEKIQMARGRIPIYSPSYLARVPARARRWAGRLSTERASAFDQLFAHGIYVAVGDREAAAQLAPRIDRSRLPADLQRLLEVRALCADGQMRQGRERALSLLEADRRRDGSMLAIAQAGVPDYDVRKLLPSENSAAERALLAQFLVNPWLDPAAFPILSEILARQGVDRKKAKPMPLSCR